MKHAQQLMVEEGNNLPILGPFYDGACNFSVQDCHRAYDEEPQIS